MALPVQWRPLASAILGDRRVRFSADAASRAALRAAGKVAATTGDVVHLARAPRAVDAPIVAHELTHVANPSPEPRFFDDHRDTPEERRAELVAEVIRRSPVLPRPASAVPPVARHSAAPPALGALATGLTRSTGAPLIARELADTPSPSSTAPVSASSMAERIAQSGTPIRRRLTATAPTGQAAPTTSNSPAEVPTPEPDSSTSTTTASTGKPTTRTWPMLTQELSSGTMQDLMDWIMEQLEDRIAQELERRGGRYRGDF